MDGSKRKHTIEEAPEHYSFQSMLDGGCGDFIKSLADVFCRADESNQERLEGVFPFNVFSFFDIIVLH